MWLFAFLGWALTRTQLRDSKRWTICTSATRGYGSAALNVVEIVAPEAIVFAEDVAQGKPKYVSIVLCFKTFPECHVTRPDPYLLGAKRCGVRPENCMYPTLER